MFIQLLRPGIRLCSSLKMSTAVNSTQEVIVEKLGPITTIGINRPNKRNCVNYKTSNMLKSAIEVFENDPTSQVAVIYGVGGNFCAGYDLSELSQADQGHVELPETGTVGPSQRFIKKPLVAAVSGYAVAGGFELALMCDMRVMEDSAIMGVYCRRFGVPLIDGGTVKLTAMVGLSRALDLILTGRSLPAKEAFEWGIANRLVPTGTALGQAINLASSLVKFPQGCLNIDRNSAYNAAFNSSFEELLKYEREHGHTVIAEESVKGAQRFVSGIGKHGKFHNLTERDVPEWEKNQLTKNKL